MFTYHYCATYQRSSSETCRWDGVAILKEKIKTMEDYRKLKVDIDSENAYRLTITSLTLI